jgi:hypothetical protein
MSDCLPKIAEGGDIMAALFTCEGRTNSRFVHSYPLSLALLALIFTFLVPVTASPADVTLAWDGNSGPVEGYRIYGREYSESYNYDNPEWEGPDTTCTISGLLEGVAYYFVARAFNEFGESNNSNEVRTSVICVNGLQTGRYETTGKGKNKIQTLVPTDTFTAGDTVVILSYITDTSNGQPVIGATVEIALSDSKNTILVSEPSNSDGVAKAIWETSTPKGKKRGGTAIGTYLATLINVTADSFIWNGSIAGAIFNIE